MEEGQEEKKQTDKTERPKCHVFGSLEIHPNNVMYVIRSIPLLAKGHVSHLRSRRRSKLEHNVIGLIFFRVIGQRITEAWSAWRYKGEVSPTSSV